MHRLISNFLVLASVLAVVVIGYVWFQASSRPTPINFVWHGQKWELVSAGWRLRLDNEPQRRFESEAPRRAVDRLLADLDESFDRERAVKRAWTPDNRMPEQLAALYNQQATLLAQMAALGYVPHIVVSPRSWAGENVLRGDAGEPLFIQAPAAAPPPATPLSSCFLPYPLLLAIALLLPCRTTAGWLLGIARDLHRQCVACGYDLRASSVRCPECGTPIRDSARWMRRWLAGRRVAHRIMTAIRRVWAIIAPRTTYLSEHWFFFICAWLAIAELPIILIAIVHEIWRSGTHWTEVGASLIRLVLDLLIAAGAARITRRPHRIFGR